MSETVNKEAIVPFEFHGQRADVVLAALFSEFSRSQLTQWLKEGLVTFDDRLLKPKEKLKGGELVKIQAQLARIDESFDAEDIPLNIVFEDEHLLIVNKPRGLVVHPGAGNPNSTLVNALIHHDALLQHLPRAGIIHRLDKDTTGLLIVAKTLPAYTALIRQMQAREIQRNYLALVHGHVMAGGRLVTFYGRHPRNRLKMAVTNQGKEAITEYKVKHHFDHFSLLDIKLLTGRTHQIRVHMSHLNHPIVGDPLYGGRARIPAGVSSSLKIALQQFKCQALHAYSLSLLHPISHEELTFTITLPDDFEQLLSKMDASDESYNT
ncbi:23S rRNA pseudouridine(1911/1915/1917) synthase RluD [Legionella impletisoli]|uniref:Pseudouridine synthase n=1 Tax=Legionella impletisoli TaxID=343510 RepID=A0A917JRW4_9GAMM|nr:23S rRNA pseudouridine(1911/1915/1917) synthase RluD [Legionella impletisoli]GGI80816.1 pseudouridine synthase [Legionella impletisoli]